MVTAREGDMEREIRDLERDLFDLAENYNGVWEAIRLQSEGWTLVYVKGTKKPEVTGWLSGISGYKIFERIDEVCFVIAFEDSTNAVEFMLRFDVAVPSPT